MKKFLLVIFTVLSLFGETVEIKDFKTDIFSKNSSSLKKIKLDLVFDINSTLTAPTYVIKDGLNIVISSFFIENLFTSQTKIQFKEILKNYLKQKHNVIVDSIYIEDMQIVNGISEDNNESR